MLRERVIMRNAAIIAVCGIFLGAPLSAAQFQPPQTAREKLNFDLSWKFKKNDQPGAA